MPLRTLRYPAEQWYMRTWMSLTVPEVNPQKDPRLQLELTRFDGRELRVRATTREAS